MTDRQKLDRWVAERLELTKKRDQLTERVEALDAMIAGLRRHLAYTITLLGDVPAPPRRRAVAETGTKALILDLLADGTRRSSAEIAAAVKLKPTGAFKTHLTELALSGDITRAGKSRATRYYIP